jgi:Fic family protein
MLVGDVTTRNAQIAAKADYFKTISQGKTLRKNLSIMTAHRSTKSSSLDYLTQRKNNVSADVKSMESKKSSGSSGRVSLNYTKSIAKHSTGILETKLDSLRAELVALQASLVVEEEINTTEPVAEQSSAAAHTAVKAVDVSPSVETVDAPAIEAEIGKVEAQIEAEIDDAEAQEQEKIEAEIAEIEAQMLSLERELAIDYRGEPNFEMDMMCSTTDTLIFNEDINIGKEELSGLGLEISAEQRALYSLDSILAVTSQAIENNGLLEQTYSSQINSFTEPAEEEENVFAK